MQTQTENNVASRPQLSLEAKARERLAPWDTRAHVLSLRGFPLASSLKWRSVHKCTCNHGEVHRDLLELNQVLGKDFLLSKRRALPEIKVCWNVTNLFEDKLPRKLTRTSERKSFKDLDTVGAMISVLYHGTYWYKRLCGAYQKREYLPLPARKLYRLLAGATRDDTRSIRQLHFATPDQASVQRFIQAISTVDGLLVQLATAFPDCDEIQSWSYFDNAIHCLICHLIEDYSAGHGPNYVSLYEKLKTYRKEVKQYGFHQVETCARVRVPRELSFLRVPTRLLDTKTLLTAFRVGILSQTRATGTPPPHFEEKTFLKFKELVTTPCAPLPRERAVVLAHATRMVWDRLVVNQPDLRERIRSAQISLKISLSDSAELFVPHSEGGKYEAFRARVASLRDKQVFVTDWSTGKPTRQLIPSGPEFSGERVFHDAFQRVVSSEIPDLMTVRAVGVPEAGKVREVTVSHLLHSLLLHPLAHFTLEILKLIPQATTGVGAANHAWQFFKRLAARNPAANFIFSAEKFYVLSTDLETATDVIDPAITKVLLGIFLGRHCLNIPPAYAAVCIALLTKPRLVQSRYSEPFLTARGVFMGDPMTKFVMHLHHLVNDEVVQMILDHGQ